MSEAETPRPKRTHAGSSSARILPQARLGGPMAWVIAIMIALTVMALAGALALNNLAQSASAEISGGVTVQIVEGAPALREQQAAMAMAVLGAREDVAQLRRVPEEELAALLEPWLGNIEDQPEEIPTPALIDVRLNGAVTETRLTQLRSAIAEVSPSARIDSQAQWLGPIFDTITSLQWLAFGLIALLVSITIAAVWLAARSALGTNHETIEVIHHLGGSDTQIARIFQRSIGIDALIGGIAGLMFGIAAIVLLSRQFSALDSGLIAGGGLQRMDWLLIGATPLIGVLLAVITAGLTVTSALRRML